MDSIGTDSVEIKGFEKSSLVDYPGKVCVVVFFGNCNFRCPYCQNPDLITHPEKLPNISERALYELFKERGEWLDALCISGGEPCLHPGLPAFIKRIKGLSQEQLGPGFPENGLLIKLDTNGSNPRMIKQLLDEKLLDYIAMDIKGPIGKYAEVANAPVDLMKIEQSVDIIKNGGIDYEFRTTVLPKLLDEQDMVNIGKWLAGSRLFAIQQFRPMNTLDPAYKQESTYSKEELERFKKLLGTYFERVELRNA